MTTTSPTTPACTNPDTTLARDYYLYQGRPGPHSPTLTVTEYRTQERERQRQYREGRNLVAAIERLSERVRKRITGVLTRKEGWPPRVREAILARDRTCQLSLVGCGKHQADDILEADHIDPEGPHSLANGRAVCPNCHRRHHLKGT